MNNYEYLLKDINSIKGIGAKTSKLFKKNRQIFGTKSRRLQLMAASLQFHKFKEDRIRLHLHFKMMFKSTYIKS